MAGQILVDFTRQPLLDFLVIMFAKLAQRFGGRSNDERLEIIVERPFFQKVGGLRRKAIFLQLVEIGFLIAAATGTDAGEGRAGRSSRHPRP